MKKKLIISLLVVTTISIGAAVVLIQKDNNIGKYVAAETSFKDKDNNTIFDSYFDKETDSDISTKPIEDESIFSTTKKELDSKVTGTSVPIGNSILKGAENKVFNANLQQVQKQSKNNQPSTSVTSKNSQSNYEVTISDQEQPLPKSEPVVKPTPKPSISIPVPEPSEPSEPSEPIVIPDPSPRSEEEQRKVTDRRIDTKYPAGLFSESEINNAINNNTAFIATDTNGNNRVNIPIRIRKNNDGSVTVYINENMQPLFNRNMQYYFFISPSRNWCDSLHIG